LISTMPNRAMLCTVIALAALAVGCETFTPETCDTSTAANPAQHYTGGTVEGGIYMSSPWDGPLLYFPGGMYYCLQHALPAAPRFWQAYVAFAESGANGDGLAEAEGNEAEVVSIAYGAEDGGSTDDGRCTSSAGAMAIEVTNSSCSSYWLLFVVDSGSSSGSP
jgi:hypothetical protein